MLVHFIVVDWWHAIDHYADDPEILAGVPVGLQLLGRTLEEEAVIAMTEIVVNALHKNKSKS